MNRFIDSAKAMIRVNQLHKKAFDREVSKTGLHRTRHYILMRLAREGKLPSQKELATHLGITPAAVTLALSKLEKDGLITRCAAEDTRYNEISITDAGMNIVTKSRDSFGKIDTMMFEGITEEEMSVFDACLKKMQDNLNILMN